MLNTKYSNQSLLTLFGRKGQTAAVAPDQLKAIAELTKRAQAGAAAIPDRPKDRIDPNEIVVPEGHVYETREEFMAKRAKAEAEMEAWEAKERAFEKENGFRREVNAPLQNLYNEALSGQLRANFFQSHQEAQDFALTAVPRVWGHLVESNRMTKGLTSNTYIEGTAKMDGIQSDQAKAKIEDHQKASQMNMLIETVILNKSLEVSGGPLYAKQDGYYHMNNVEVRYSGKLVLTVEEHGGKITLFNEDGSTRDPGQMYQVAQNQPGAYTQKAAG